jgi:hypothetical protein
MACPASFALSLQMPEPPESPYATEGSRLHDLAAAYLQQREPADPVMSGADYAFLLPYLEHCAKLMQRTMTQGWLIETRVAYSPLLGGTADFMAWDMDGTLDVVDLKTGAGVAVDPDDNKQLLTYAGMALATTPQLKGISRVRLTIVQPPSDPPVKTWETTRERVEQHMVEAQAAIDASLTPAQTPVPGDHCRWCKAKPICPTLRGYVAEVGNHLPAALQPEVIGLWLDRATQVEGFITDLRAFAHTYATTALGQQRLGIPGYVLKPKRATRQWANEDAVLEIARRRKIKIWQDKLMSPAMAEKAHPNMPAELTEQIVSISSGTNLVKGATEALGLASAPPSLAASLALLKHRI